MARHRYLVAYDIRHPTRLRAVRKAMKDYGEPLQYSVFVCDLDGTEKPGMLIRLGLLIKHSVDSVMVVDLGIAVNSGKLPFEFLGTHRPLPGNGSVII